MQTLLIDDDSISIFLTKKLFQREGLSQGLHSFESPGQALCYVQQAVARQQPPDVILLDLHMPVLNGWDFLAALQPYQTQLDGHCFIYILTSSLSPTDKVRSQALSLVTDFIAKPLDSAQIQAIQAQVLAHQRSLPLQ